MSKNIHRIAILAGDGIGPEIMAQALKVLHAVEDKFHHHFELTEAPMGGAAIDIAGVPLPDSTLQIARESDAILMASVGDFKYDTLPSEIRPERGLLKLRKSLDLYANLRPVKSYACLAAISTLKQEITKNIDLLVIRELTGGIYFGQPRERSGEGAEEKALDTLVYTRPEIERIARIGFEMAQQRRKNLMSVDKANVLASSQLWRDVVNEMAPSYPDVTVNHMYVDNAAMQLILKPDQFDVILTENMFGDILSDEASMLTGSLGMLPSASLGVTSTNAASNTPPDSKKDFKKRPALYEPCHGSAPQLAGQDKANPIAQILSLALMLDYSFGYQAIAAQIEQAIGKVLNDGYRTFDILGDNSDDSIKTTLVGTAELGQRITEAFLNL